MRASLNVAGVELGISTPAGHLEDVVLRSCSAYLGPPSASTCSVVLAPPDGTITPHRGVAASITGGRARLRGDACGEIDLVSGGTLTVLPDAVTVRTALRLLVNALAPSFDVLVVRGSASMSALGATVTLGDAVHPGDAAMLGAGCVGIAAHNGGWTVHSTPFDDGSEAAVARHAALETCWIEGETASTESILDHLAGPLDADGQRRADTLVSRLLPWVTPTGEDVRVDV